jgi:LacI family transcriptional regulator
MGNPRYRCQEVNESGFRSYFRENDSGFSILEPLLTFESSAVSQEMTETLLRENPDLKGLYVAGGGISGVISAIRNANMSGRLTVVGYELMDSTRDALLDGTLTFVISIPLQKLAAETIDGMIRAAGRQSDAGNYTSILPFDLYTRESV